MNTATLEAKVQEAAQSDVGNRPAEGRITDEAVAAARAMIGLHLRPAPHRFGQGHSALAQLPEIADHDEAVQLCDAQQRNEAD